MIDSYHAHIYFDATTMDAAIALSEAAAARFELVLGRAHTGPVGPHPMGSRQLACAPAVFAALLPWLAMNRNGLIVFAHPETGDPLADHRDRAIWLGAGLPLDLSIFGRDATVLPKS